MTATGLTCALGVLVAPPSSAQLLTPNSSYWVVTSGGDVYGLGGAPYYGSTAKLKLSKPIVGMAATPNGDGYWLVASDGGIFAFGGAAFHGSMGGVALNRPVVGMTADPATGGYWLVSSDGGIFSFGAPFYGSTGAIRLNQPIVSMATTPDGRGYWLVGRDGGVFAFGDAGFFGSLPQLPRSVQPHSHVVTLVPSNDGLGYMEVTAAGDVFNFGDSPFEGSASNTALSAPIVAAAETPGGPGYWLVGSDGGVFSYGDAGFSGSPSSLPASDQLGFPVVTLVPSPLLSGSWSGYTQNGTDVTRVSGTFTVPSLTSAATSGSELAAWVGIDGLGNDSLIQAGVLEYPNSGLLGTGLLGSTVIEPWWEIIPNDEQPIGGMTISAGDQVTVVISQISAGLFQITLADVTSGQHFSIDQSYDGPMESADWIAESPSVNGTVVSLAPYGPPIEFSNISSTMASPSGLNELILDQNGPYVSVPSAIAGNEFAISYEAP